MSFQLGKVSISATETWSVTNIATTAIEFPAPSTTFDHLAFWKEFFNKNQPNTAEDAIELVFDACRYHLSPNESLLPKVELSYTLGDGTTNKTVNLILKPSHSRIQKPLKSQRGSLYSYTYICLATSGIFSQLFLRDAATTAIVTTARPNMWRGISTYFGLIENFTEIHQANSEAQMEKWVTDTGLKARDAKVDAIVKKAARKTIADRSAGTIAVALDVDGILQFVQNKPVTHFYNSARLITSLNVP